MRVDLSDGLLIEGDAEELRALARDLKSVAKDGIEEQATILTDAGVERVTIRLAER